MNLVLPPLPGAAIVLADAGAQVLSDAAIVTTAACAICAAGLALLMRPGKTGVRIGGTVLGLAGFATLVMEAIGRAGGGDVADGPAFPPVFPVVFGCIGIAGAVRLITHPKPVFAALYFILVVIATGGMFLLLGAEFMAFSIIIVYAGAILITYMFVLMLAQQTPADGGGVAWYDRTPRESVAAVVVGFMMLATLSDAYFSAKSQGFLNVAGASSAAQGDRRAWERLETMPKLLVEQAEAAYRANPGAREGISVVGIVPRADDRLIGLAPTSVMKRTPEGLQPSPMAGVTATVEAKLSDGSTFTIGLPASARPENTRQVGVDLVSRFPASLEIAGVVLLMALFGAVILARRQIELGEDERRELAGMRRLTVDGEPGGAGGMR